MYIEFRYVPILIHEQSQIHTPRKKKKMVNVFILPPTEGRLESENMKAIRETFFLVLYCWVEKREGER